MNIVKTVKVKLLVGFAVGLGCSAPSYAAQQAESGQVAASSESDRADADELIRQLRFDLTTKAIQQSWEFNDLAKTRYWLEEQRPREGESDLRGFPWQYFNRLAHRETALKHVEDCGCVSISPNGDQMLSVSRDKILVWDLATQTVKFELHHRFVDMVTYSDDGKLFASAARYISGAKDRVVNLCSAETCEQVASFPGANQFFFSPDKRLLALTIDAEVQVYDLTRREEIARLKGHQGAVLCVCFSMDGTRIATGSVDKTARLWDATNGNELMTLDQNRSYIDAVAFWENSSKLITATRGGPIKLWDLISGTETNHFREPARFGGGSGKLVLSKDANLLVSVANYAGASYVDIWDMKSGNKRHKLESDSGNLDAIFVGQSDYLAVVDAPRGTIGIWSTKNWKQAESFKFVQVEKVLFNKCLSASDNGSLLAFPVGKNALLFDTAMLIGGGNDPQSKPPTAVGTRNGLEPLFVIGSDIVNFDGRAQLVTRQESITHEQPLENVAIASDGQLVAGSIAGRSDVLLWHNLSEQPIAIPVEGIGERDAKGVSKIHLLALSPDGRRLAVLDNRSLLRIYDSTTHNKVAELRGIDGVSHCAVSNSNIVAAVLGNQIQLWNANSSKLIGTVEQQKGPLTALTFSSDGIHLATAGWMTAMIWKIADQSCQQTIELRSGVSNPPKFYRTVAFHPDGKSVFVGGNKGIIQVDIATGKKIASLSTGFWEDELWNLRSLKGSNFWSSSHDEVITVAVSSNGEKVAAQFGDGRVYVWSVSDGFGVAATSLPSIMRDLAFGKGGDEIIAGGHKIQFTNCRTPNWKQSPTPYGQASSYRYTLSPDGRFAAIGILEKTQFQDALRKPQPAVIKVLNLQTGVVVNQLRPKHGLISMAISPSSPILAVAGYQRDDGHTMSDISLWNFETGELLGELQGKSNTLAFSADGSFLTGVILGDHPLKLPQSPLTTWLANDNITAIAFAPKGNGRNLLATATKDGDVQIWDYKSNTELATMIGHNGQVRALVFSLDGLSLVSGGVDSKVRFWNLTTFMESLALDMKKAIVNLKFTNSGQNLAVQLMDGDVQLLRGAR